MDRHGTQQRTFMGRLARDVRGTTMAMMAAALIPLAGMMGGGLDIARMYLVKTRLQHACDAGALAGRKAMGGGQWSQSGYAPRATAERFFAANFANDAYGSYGTERQFSETAGKVSGMASATVGMTLTRVIGFTEKKLDVTCEAEMRLPNTDVMFVLDVTGSMNDKAVSTDSQTKMQALRSAVKCFYEILQKLDTDEVCVGGPPSGGLSDQVQVRFGFVPYSVNVNVGRLLPKDFIANRWTYQSREVADEPVHGKFVDWYGAASGSNLDSYGTFGGWIATDQVKTVSGSGACNVALFGNPADIYTPTKQTRAWPVNNSYDGTTWRALTPAIVRNFTNALYTATGKTCTLRYRERTIRRMATHTMVDKNDPDAVAFAQWVYRPIDHDISALKNTPTTTSVNLPVGQFNAMTAVGWQGCIEERQTVRATKYDPIPAGALDLDLKSSPTSDKATQWGPLLNGVVFPRWDTAGYTTAEVRTFNAVSSVSGYCPTAARKLEVMDNATVFQNYVNSIVVGGNTYHDIGMIWGARLMWPTGIFRSENEFASKGGEIQRHLIFMTDGDACTAIGNYQAYGFAPIDRRQTDPKVIPTDGCSTTGTLTQQVNERTQAVCKQVRNENITLWVIWFGVKNTTIEKLMTSCATEGRFYTARDSAQLQNTFRQIADQISQLRITQ